MGLYDKEYFNKFQERVKEWKTRVKKLKEKDLPFESDSGISIKKLYTPIDIKDHDYLESVGFPGEAPFTRGDLPQHVSGSDLDNAIIFRARYPRGNW